MSSENADIKLKPVIEILTKHKKPPPTRLTTPQVFFKAKPRIKNYEKKLFEIKGLPSTMDFYPAASLVFTCCLQHFWILIKHK